VPMPETTAKINNSIEYLESLKSPAVKPAINILKGWKRAIQRKDLTNIETLRKQLGEEFTAPELTTVRSTTEKVLSNIYDSVNTDMGQYIATHGTAADFNKWQTSNKALSAMMDKLDLPFLKRVIDRGAETPEVIRSMLFSADRSTVKTLYGELTPQGRAHARAALLAQMAKTPENALLSPDRAASEFHRLGEQFGIFFDADALNEIKGLFRVIDVTKRASQAAVMPTTGVQAVIPAGAAALASIFGGGLTGFVGSMGSVLGIGALAKVYESPTVRNILMKIPTVKVGGPEEAALFKRLLEAVQATQAASAASGEAR
jgi:hypothetical protein